MDTRRFTAILAVTATVLTACRVGGASSEEYAAVRDAFDETMSESNGAPVNLDISNGEIDCIAKAVDVPVDELDELILDDDDSDDETTAEVFRCMDNDTVRSLFEGLLGSDEDAAAAGFDRGCVLDKIVEAFDEWKKTDGDQDDLDEAWDEAARDTACRLDN